ncbi:MAG: flavodoxin family protein [Candidatus Micrarchaeota archaeon]|nr:flavodoxin family protein [Candidatus Micrarchaeota archaeon]
MKALVLYDSNFGNTKVIADAISKQLGVFSTSVKGFKESDLSGVSLLIVGSPINAWGPTEGTARALATLKRIGLKGIKAAAFDTRIKMVISGDAAKKISKVLKEAGAEIVAEPTGFFVKGKEGPLADGEEKRAAEWAKRMA